MRKAGLKLIPENSICQEGGQCLDAHPGHLQGPSASRLFKQQLIHCLYFSSTDLAVVAWVGNGPWWEGTSPSSTLRQGSQTQMSSADQQITSMVTSYPQSKKTLES